MEKINIFNSNYTSKGVMTYEEAHQNEEWHETFQCIFTYKDFVILQKRSQELSDYTGMLDVSIGGHIRHDETMADCVREIKEELGIDVSFDDLKMLCVIPESIDNEGTMDKEFINIFTCEISRELLDKIVIDNHEVEDLILMNILDFKSLLQNKQKVLSGKTFKDDEKFEITKQMFIPYSDKYFCIVSEVI
ncbi:NUDIX hydrolase [Macrococcoides bohemicum]|uniref:NUDIX hydrolase n=1 Tax=Macrococcoides bohemicum TaxID=1903056 RepID=UPI00193F560A|nr:NUDIX domain-containing protein [Macrococcus bohemicus]QRN49627.1 NUDIX domain-containing protein [Macrococcus bohemicus]